MYDELDQVQRAEWAKKDKEKKERTKVQMVSAVKKTWVGLFGRVSRRLKEL